MAHDYKLVDPQLKSRIAAIEQSGKSTGDWAQFRSDKSAALRELHRQGKFSGVTYAQLLKSPPLYDKAVADYAATMTKVPSNTVDKALWWYLPNMYTETGGDISKIKNPEYRKNMLTRVKNMLTISKDLSADERARLQAMLKAGGN